MARIKTGRGPLTLTYAKHKDDRETLVLVEGKIYRLTLHETYPTVEAFRRLPADQPVPHVRLLSPIPERSIEEQVKANADRDFIHGLAIQCSTTNTKITSVAKAVSLGADVPKEVMRLLEEKKTATGDAARKIRIQLRKLDYKRYLNKGDQK